MNYFVKVLFGFFILLSTYLSAQYNSICVQSFVYPSKQEFGDVKNLVSLTLAKLPEDAVEEASSYIYAPLINYNVLYGLPLGFSARGNVSTNWITLHLSLGPKWTYQYKRISIALGYDVAYVYGRLFKFGFNSKIKGWLNYPNITLGIAFNKFTMSFKVDASFITSVEQFNDDIEVGTDRNRIAGVSLGVFIEQPLWNNNYVTLAFKGNYTRLYYPAWAVFPTWDRYNFIPEVIIGLVL
jgi:hypothetical protein